MYVSTIVNTLFTVYVSKIADTLCTVYVPTIADTLCTLYVSKIADTLCTLYVPTIADTLCTVYVPTIAGTLRDNTMYYVCPFMFCYHITIVKYIVLYITDMYSATITNHLQARVTKRSQ